MNFLIADESVDYYLVQELRSSGFNILSILETSPGISDDEVLEIANTRKALLLTEDKDFGELLIRFKKSHYGILLIRLPGIDQDKKKRLVMETLSKHTNDMINNLSVLSEEKLRIRNI